MSLKSGTAWHVSAGIILSRQAAINMMPSIIPVNRTFFNSSFTFRILPGEDL
jgi:hypothetical protein